jgi:hypothetical protein
MQTQPKIPSNLEKTVSLPSLSQAVYNIENTVISIKDEMYGLECEVLLMESKLLLDVYNDSNGDSTEEKVARLNILTEANGVISSKMTKIRGLKTSISRFEAILDHVSTLIEFSLMHKFASVEVKHLPLVVKQMLELN